MPIFKPQDFIASPKESTQVANNRQQICKRRVKIITFPVLSMTNEIA